MESQQMELLLAVREDMIAGREKLTLYKKT
jgi:hypothetical protein